MPCTGPCLAGISTSARLLIFTFCIGRLLGDSGKQFPMVGPPLKFFVVCFIWEAHLGVLVEYGAGYPLDSVGRMSEPLLRDERGHVDQRKVDLGKGNQIRLELVHVNV